MRAMTTRFGRVMRLGVLLAVTLLVVASAAFAQEKASGEAIKVHGHWTIDVKNPDGTLAAHHEFENALQFTGQGSLAILLSHQSTVVGWHIFVNDGSAGAFGFLIQEQSVATFSGPGSSANLTVTIGNQQVVLQGSVAAAFPLQIAEVETLIWTQTQPSPPGATPGASVFSKRALPQPIAVQANQIIQATVVFSFS